MRPNRWGKPRPKPLMRALDRGHRRSAGDRRTQRPHSAPRPRSLATPIAAQHHEKVRLNELSPLLARLRIVGGDAIAGLPQIFQFRHAAHQFGQRVVHHPLQAPALDQRDQRQRVEVAGRIA